MRRPSINHHSSERSASNNAQCFIHITTRVKRYISFLVAPYLFLQIFSSALLLANTASFAVWFQILLQEHLDATI